MGPASQSHGVTLKQLQSFVCDRRHVHANDGGVTEVPASSSYGSRQTIALEPSPRTAFPVMIAALVRFHAIFLLGNDLNRDAAELGGDATAPP